MNVSDILASAPPQALHPALDVQGDLLTYGFRSGEQVLHVLSDGGKPAATADQHVELAKRTLRYQHTKGPLASLDDQWDREDLREFLDSPTALSGSQLYSMLKAVWQKHVDFDHEGKYVILVCWGLMTYVYPVFSSVPFIHLLGPKGTGKSQALD